jgi:flagellin
MGLRITNNQTVQNNIEKARREAANSLEKLSSGVVFTRDDPKPAERALSDSLTSKLRELSSYKQNANDGVSLVQTADSALGEVSNMVIRLKEITTQASSPTLSDNERKFLFVEYKSLYDEIDRVAQTTSFNGMGLLAGGQGAPAKIGFRVGPPSGSGEEDDRNVVSIQGIGEISSSTERLGLKDVNDFLRGNSGVSLDDVLDFFDSSDSSVSSSFDSALETLAGFRSVFGAVGSRLGHVMDVLDIATENTAAAQSRLRDVDYATEVTNLTKANILVQAGASLLTQGNVPAQVALTLINGLQR